MPPKPPTTVKKGPKQLQKKAKKEPLPVPERLKRLFTSLCAQIDGGHFNNALKTCDKILRLQPDDPDARQTKLFLLLQTDQYEAALQLMDLDGDSKKNSFERAYTLYRLHRESEVVEAVKVVKEERGEDDRGVAHLEAQLHYREGDYEAALSLYNDLLVTVDENSEEYTDIGVNLQAVQAHHDFIQGGFRRALDALPASVTSSLETAPPPAQPTSAATALSTASAIANASASTQPTTAPKKVRMRRVPAGVTPGVGPPPDPERWLKKSERSTYHQGKRRKGGGGATQGASVDASPSPAPVAQAAKSGGAKGKKRR